MHMVNRRWRFNKNDVTIFHELSFHEKFSWMPKWSVTYNESFQTTFANLQGIRRTKYITMLSGGLRDVAQESSNFINLPTTGILDVSDAAVSLRCQHYCFLRNDIHRGNPSNFHIRWFIIPCTNSQRKKLGLCPFHSFPSLSSNENFRPHEKAF